MLYELEVGSAKSGRKPLYIPVEMRSGSFTFRCTRKRTQRRKWISCCSKKKESWFRLRPILEKPARWALCTHSWSPLHTMWQCGSTRDGGTWMRKQVWGLLALCRQRRRVSECPWAHVRKKIPDPHRSANPGFGSQVG